MFELTLPTMTCGHCTRAVTAAIEELDPLAKVQIDLASHRVSVDTAHERQAVEAALIEAGYTPA